MANRFFSPDQQFLSNSGVPYAGGLLNFYATGTSTPLNTYSDQALTIANTNPVVLDSNGQAGSIFLQNLAYKVVLTDSNSNQIWTMDPVYSSDYSTFAAFTPWNGNPNGNVAGTAGTAGSLPGTSVVWDYTDNLLYVCTQTGNAGTAVWTAINAAAATPATPAPQGYLTVASDPSNPIITGDTLSQTTVYYTPWVGNLIPVYNGSSFVTTSFSQLSLALTASQALSTIYDVFIFSNSGVLTMVTGPAWSVSTAGSGARGTGGGTTQIQRLNGLWVNAVQISGKNGASTYTIPANTATYVGSIFIDTVAGQVSCYRSYGQSRKFGVWNAYNRQPIIMKAGDSTASWSPGTVSVRAQNANSANTMAMFCGLPEELGQFTRQQTVGMTWNQNGNNSFAISFSTIIGIGVNVTNAYSGTESQCSWGYATNNTATWVTQNGSQNFCLVANYTQLPFIGVNNINMLETNSVSSITQNFNGTEAFNLMLGSYRG